MNIEEENLLDMLTSIWNKFLELPELHSWEKQEFMHAIHSAQVIIMARPTMRKEKEISYVICP